MGGDWYVLAELSASGVRGPQGEDIGPIPESMASQARRKAGNCAEVSGKVTLVGETCHNRDLREWKVGVSQQLLCMLDPSLHDIVVRRYSDRLAERAGKMMNRQLCHVGEHVKSDIFLQMRIYVFAYAISACRRKAAAIRGQIRREWQVCEHAESRT
jgi:hypothetical protein